MRFFVCLFVALVGSSYLQAAEDSGVREISLSEITSTSYQNGLLRPGQSHLGDTNNEKIGKSIWLDEVYAKTAKMGASNIFLVDAPTYFSAVAATSRVLDGAHSADSPPTINEVNPPRGNYWLVAFLGVEASDPPQWLVDKVTVESKTIQFAYHHVKPGAATADLHQYLYWVPLKALPNGTYQLELFDTEANVVTLSRRVIVGK